MCFANWGLNSCMCSCCLSSLLSGDEVITWSPSTAKSRLSSSPRQLSWTSGAVRGAEDAEASVQPPDFPPSPLLFCYSVGTLPVVALQRRLQSVGGFPCGHSRWQGSSKRRWARMSALATPQPKEAFRVYNIQWILVVNTKKKKSLCCFTKTVTNTHTEGT